MTEQEKQIPTLLKDKKYLFEFFSTHLKQINPKAAKIVSLESYFIKKHEDKNFFHFVIQNNIRLETQEGLRRRYKIYCASFSGHKRKKMFQVLELAYKNGFQTGATIVPHPLFYSEKLMAAFYIGVPGENFLEHIKNGYLNHKIIQQIGSGLARFHKIDLTDKSINLARHNFTLAYLDPTHILARGYNQNDLHDKILSHFKKLQDPYLDLAEDMGLALSHGDFHPENVIVNKFDSNQVAIIDFSEACLAPIYYDIASFLEQLEFMTMSYVSHEDYQAAEKIFLSGYFANTPITPDIRRFINLYKSWTALKSTVYFMIFADEINRRFAKHLLNKAEYFYKQL